MGATILLSPQDIFDQSTILQANRILSDPSHVNPEYSLYHICTGSAHVITIWGEIYSEMSFV